MGEFNCLKHGNKRLSITILILFLGIIFCLSTYDFLMREKGDKLINTSIVSNLAYNTSEDMFIKELEKAKEINEDVLGIIEIPHTEFRRFFVQSVDNKDYLAQDIYKEKNKTGVPFLDYRVNVDSNKLIIYGHNSVYYDAPFRFLENYYEEDFYSEHKFINVRTEDKLLRFEIFSVYVEPSDWDYIKTEFRTKEEYKSHLEKLKSKSMYTSDVALDENDQILILQTCSFKTEYKNYEKKFLLIVARRV